MPDAPAPLAPQIEFLENHRPALQSGVYEVAVQQQVSAPGLPDGGVAFAAAERFGVFGERFALDDEDVVAVFPPAGSLGDHANVLPHVVLTRSTLPWERDAVAAPRELTDAERQVPWLALLVFTEGEVAAPTVTTLAKLKAADAALGWPGLALEVAQHDDDPVAVVDVPAALLQEVLPAVPEVRLLAHARRPMAADGVTVAGDEWAVVVANRLPEGGSNSVAHLVSVEGRYRAGATEGAYAFDTGGAAPDGTVRLVTLKSWRFSCSPDTGSLAELLQGLDRQPATLRIPVGEAVAEPYLERGYVPCPHLLRRGARTVSWYHGPCVPPDAVEAAPALPVHAADELVRYHEDTGLFDVGYAAAWELGRLLAMNASRFSEALFRWRHSVARFTRAEAGLAAPHHRVGAGATTAPALPAVGTDWLAEAGGLEGLPFNYLVADERLLPPESLRLFRLDPAWLACFTDGAFSVGRVTQAQHEGDAVHLPEVAALTPSEVTGVLIRSAAIAGWPSLVVEGYDRQLAPGLHETTDPLPETARRTLLRMDRLSPNVLLCLWDGRVDAVQVHQPAEALHFGFHDAPSGGVDHFSRRLRDADGEDLDSVVVDPVPFRPGGARVVDVAALADAVAAALPDGAPPMNSATFALQLVEGVPLVRFDFG